MTYYYNDKCPYNDKLTGDCNNWKLAHMTPKCDENCKEYLKTIKIKCDWCGGNALPFHKLNPDIYGNDKFTCNKCYKEIEKEQKLLDDLF